jgi:hypothetical protein
VNKQVDGSIHLWCSQADEQIFAGRYTHREAAAAPQDLTFGHKNVRATFYSPTRWPPTFDERLYNFRRHGCMSNWLSQEKTTIFLSLNTDVL